MIMLEKYKTVFFVYTPGRFQNNSTFRCRSGISQPKCNRSFKNRRFCRFWRLLLKDRNAKLKLFLLHTGTVISWSAWKVGQCATLKNPTMNQATAWKYNPCQGQSISVKLTYESYLINSKLLFRSKLSTNSFYSVYLSVLNININFNFAADAVDVPDAESLLRRRI